MCERGLPVDADRLQKPCVVCGEECAGRPRTRDSSGQYYHNECYESARRSRREAADAETVAEPAEDGTFPLLDDETLE